MRDALSILDQVASFCQGDITFDKVIEDQDTKVLIVRPLHEPTSEMITDISMLPHVVEARQLGGEISVRFKGEMEDVAAFYKDLAGLRYPICSMSESPNALEDKYLSLVQESR